MRLGRLFVVIEIELSGKLIWKIELEEKIRIEAAEQVNEGFCSVLMYFGILNLILDGLGDCQPKNCKQTNNFAIFYLGLVSSYKLVAC